MESYFPPIELGHSSTSLSASVHPDAGNPNPADLRAYDSSATSQSNCRRSIEDAKTDSGQSLASVNVMSVSSSESDSGPESGSDDCDNASKLNCHKPVRESKKRHCFYVPPGGSRFDRTSSGAYGAKKQKLDIVRQRSKHSKSCGCKEEETVNIDEPILFMILQLSHFYIRMFNSPFARNNVFSVLLDYISSVSVPHERASLILAAILKNELNFKTLIVNGFIEELDEKMHVLHDLRCCYRCYNLQKIHQQIIESCRFLVEKDFIRQTLYGLLRSNECDIKLHAMYAISRLVIDKYALLDILYTKNAIQVIFSSLCSESKTEQEKALVCICEIYKNTSSEKKRRIAEFHPNKSKIPVFCQAKKNPTCSFEGDYELDVEFLLDCGTKVLACRGKMSEQSDYFRALLSGYFSEGKSKLIQLPNITKNALSVILHFLHGCGDQGYCPYFDKIPMKLLLELLAKSEEFLLFSLKTRVEKNLASYLSHKTVVNIYRSGKLHNSSNLCDKTIDYLLTLDTLNKKAFPKPFNELMCQEFINDLKSFVNDHLKVPVPSVETKSEKIFLKYI
ncbi:uncharacterized protein LOC129231664 [Uloborus diversus]|uniref:uncharacterized protein LOC129231664 n=1 Tax=Uloborus diversus TaxID=327109 RepID=UPI002408FBDD|nr:uncharacterized protein LOC129231664 [Uloborus diversus]